MTPSTRQPVLLSVQTGRARTYGDGGDGRGPWTSAIDKKRVEGPVRLSHNGLDGDEQVDRRHHGGPDKAVLVYSADHYADWNERYPETQFERGGFGENLTVANLNEQTTCIGDTLQIGNCRLEVSQPRQPCWKLAGRWNKPALTAIVLQTGRTGWYCRVLEQGSLEAGLPIELIDRPFPDVTITWANSVMYARPRSAGDDAQLAACPALADAWRDTLMSR